MKGSAKRSTSKSNKKQNSASKSAQKAEKKLNIKDILCMQMLKNEIIENNQDGQIIANFAQLQLYLNGLSSTQMAKYSPMQQQNYDRIAQKLTGNQIESLWQISTDKLKQENADSRIRLECLKLIKSLMGASKHSHQQLRQMIDSQNSSKKQIELLQMVGKIQLLKN